MSLRIEDHSVRNLYHWEKIVKQKVSRTLSSRVSLTQKQVDHTLDDKGLWFQADHTLDHKGLWSQVDHIWSRVWPAWNHKHLCCTV